MGLNFSALVDKPAFNLFARPVTVTPVKSQPGAGSYVARGIFDTSPLDVVTQDGSIYSDMETTLAIIMSEFAVVPKQLDIIDVPADAGLPAEGQFEVVDNPDDGAGLMTLKLRKKVAP